MKRSRALEILLNLSHADVCDTVPDQRGIYMNVCTCGLSQLIADCRNLRKPTPLGDVLDIIHKLPHGPTCLHCVDGSNCTCGLWELDRFLYNKRYIIIM